MLHEYRDLITELKENRKSHEHFFHQFDRHNKLDEIITNEYQHLTDMELS